jgi:hypothetical protein
MPISFRLLLPYTNKVYLFFIFYVNVDYQNLLEIIEIFLSRN